MRDERKGKTTVNHPSYFWIASLLLLVFVVSKTRYSFGSVEEPSCYGFIRDGALALNCRGERTTGLDLAIEGFAVSSDGNWLAIKRTIVKPGGQNGVGQAVDNSKLIGLSNNAVKAIDLDPNVIWSSCGRLLIVHDQTSIFDPVLDKPFRMAGYSLVRCSTDQTVTVGYPEQDAMKLTHSLWLGRPTKRLLSNSNAYLGFDISLNGDFVAFKDMREGGVDSLCLAKGEMSPHCLRDLFLPGPALSVSDTGHVLYEQYTADGCYSGNGVHFSKNSKNVVDACISIFDWSLEQTAPKLIEDLAHNPQWIPNAGPVKSWLRKRIKV
jgi:hypothetical protein